MSAGVASCVRRVAMLAIVTGSLTFGTAAVHADAPSISGSLYKLRWGDKTSVAVVGASAYVHRPEDPTAQWIGPILTDRYGRFVFYNIPSGKYVLRIYSSTIRLWQQVLTVPAENLGSIVIPDVRLVYFVKPMDPSGLERSLERVPLPYDSEARKLQIPTNTIWFGDLVQPQYVKEVAQALLEAHASLRAIRKFSVSSDWHAKIIEVGSDPALANGRTLSAADVTAATSFPRATGKSEDQR